MMTTSAPASSRASVAWGTPMNVGMSSASMGNSRPLTQWLDRISSQVG